MTRQARIGLALAGGGLEGAVYEIGALRALDETLDGIDFNDLHVYVGVSAGSFLAACLANGLTTSRLCRAILKHGEDDHPFVPEIFFKPAVGELLRRGLMTPRLALEALSEYVSDSDDRSLVGSFGVRLSRALPVGIFDNEPIRQYLSRVFSMLGRTDDFRELATKLIVVASDLDSGEAVRFGEPGRDHVPISRAVQASSALPAIYPPVEIDGRHYLDGVLIKTLHASVALDSGARLVICVNPIVPVDTEDSVEAGVMRRGKLIHRGLPTVLAQTFRTLVHSRLAVGVASYEPRYPQADLVLFEPERDDYRMFFTNIFSFASRKAVCEHAYDSVRRQLRKRRAELEPIFARHGITMRHDLLDDPDRDPWTEAGLPDDRPPRGVADTLDRTLRKLERMLEDEPTPN
jgi:predicted acylesterase/phospholipase RssA